MNEGKVAKSEFAIASLVLGIVSFIQLAGLEKSILAVVFGILALRRIGRAEGMRGKNLSVAGIVLGIISIIVTIVFLVMYFPQLSEQMGTG